MGICHSIHSIISKMMQHLDCRLNGETSQKGGTEYIGNQLTLSNIWTVNIKRIGRKVELKVHMTRGSAKKPVRRQRRPWQRLHRRSVINDQDDEGSEGFEPTSNNDDTVDIETLQSEDDATRSTSEDPRMPMNVVPPIMEPSTPQYQVERAVRYQELKFTLAI